MTAELDGARQNAEFVHRVAHPKSQVDMLATAILLIIQHLEKHT